MRRRPTARRAAALIGSALALLLLTLASPAIAHQPQIVGYDARVRIEDPEVSRAFYGHLPGVPARYEITSRAPFALYAQITIPDIAGARRDFRLQITGPGGRLALLTTPAAAWDDFFEPFGGDHYLTGPEFRRRVGPGHYTVGVSRPGNRGTYVLAIGESEEWGPGAALAALAALPTIKREYFRQSLPQAWLTRTVPVIAILLAIFALGCWLLVRQVRHRGRAAGGES